MDQSEALKCSRCGHSFANLLWFNSNKMCRLCYEKEQLLKSVKTEDLTFQEACAAIGRGEFPQDELTGDIFSALGYWDIQDKQWNKNSTLPMQTTYRLAPDPSKLKPEPVKDPRVDLNTLYTLSSKCTICKEPSVLDFCASHIPHNLKRKDIDWIKKHVDPHFDKRVLVLSPMDENEWSLLVMRILNQDFNSLAKPERSLTYEEALECEKVLVYLPQLDGLPAKYERCMGVWPVAYLHAFDLAERRGYRMEKIE